MIETPCLLDTDTLSYIFKGREPVHTVSLHYLQRYEEFSISCITFYECLRGHLANNATKRVDDFYSFLMFADIIYLDRPIIEMAAEIYGRLKPQGVLPGDADILIAATALVRGKSVVTNNEKHYAAIHEHFALDVENWMTQKASFLQQDEENTQEGIREE
ncbi:MAG: type II toxin-antitoxin system VapC family toxin [Candidatus Babeliaceae bacterium]|nr:type II toxin-antitoxin system VapC family toxin [Candidatus Babeliaceae bacterium]